MNQLTKEQALHSAEKLLTHIYDGEVELVARVCVASADKNTEYLYHALDELEKFIELIKEGLKQ